MKMFTKGELEEVIECSNAISLLSKEDGSQVAQVMDEEGDDLTETQKANAEELVRRWNAFEKDFSVDLIANAEKTKQQRDDLLEVCEAWMKVESEMKDKNPCPDLALRANYRKEAVKLTEAAIAK